MEFVVIDQNRSIIDRASSIENLSKNGLPGTLTIELDANFLIGDSVSETGHVSHSNSSDSERMKAADENGKKRALINSIKSKMETLGFTKQEIAVLIK